MCSPGNRPQEGALVLESIGRAEGTGATLYLVIFDPALPATHAISLEQ